MHFPGGTHMTNEITKTVKIKVSTLSYILAILVPLVFSLSNANAAKLSDHFAMNIDPYSEKMVGKDVTKSVTEFFHAAEKAIESEDIESLMGLYSDNYKNGEHDKASVKKIWQRIFGRFNSMATLHNMRFITTSPESETMIIRCSGLLVGVPEGEKNRMTIDNWTDADHILVMEKGKWKLIGTAGKSNERLWFDKPMHPLF